MEALRIYHCKASDYPEDDISAQTPADAANRYAHSRLDAHGTILLERKAKLGAGIVVTVREGNGSESQWVINENGPHPLAND